MAMPKTPPEQWKALSDGPPWTHTVGSHASANRAAREMRKDGFSGVHVERYEPISVSASLLVPIESSDNVTAAPQMQSSIPEKYKS